MEPESMPELWLGLSATAWAGIAAIATAITVAVATAAAIAALRQLAQARELAEEQARPHVIAFIAESEADRQILDFVVKNVGTTAARRLSVTIDPPYERSNELAGNEFLKARFLRDEISVLPPGGEMRTFLDTTRDLSQTGDTTRPFTVKLAYRDRLDKLLTDDIPLDPFDAMGTVRTDVHGLHHIAKTLRAMAKKQGVSSF